MKLLITGASGHLGRATADRLLESIDPRDLILTSRAPAALSSYADRGVAVREADFERPETLAAAFAGAERMLLISTDALGRRGPQHDAAVAAAVAAGVGFITYTSFPSFGPDDVLSAEHSATEKQIRESGAAWCILRNFPYAETDIAAMHEALARGELVTNTRSAGTAFVARRDCADVAAAVLAGSGHDGCTHDVTGPALLDAQDRATIYQQISGTPVVVRHVDDEEMARDLSEHGGPPFPVALAIVGAVGRATRDGRFASVSDTVERLTGSPATPLSAVLRNALTAP